MEQSRYDQLRRLALWLSRRRAVDEALTALTAYGPAACDRVHSHLEALVRLQRLEQEAFAEVQAAAPAVPQSPLPDAMESSPGSATVHALRDEHRPSSA